MLTYIYRNAITLGLFAVISAGLVGLVHHWTRDRIQSEKEAALYRMLHQVISPDAHDNDLYQDCRLVIAPESLGTKEPVRVFRARKDGHPVALIIQSIAPDGYNGAIELLVGVEERNRVTGVGVISHQETPGLGDQIEQRKSPWLKQFSGKDLLHAPAEQWKVRKDGGVFDALTGATITPRAVVRAVHETLTYANRHWDKLFNEPANCH
jgi:electron transport complex protein RnfG